MRVIGFHSAYAEHALEEPTRRQILPYLTGRLSAFDPTKNFVLPRRVELDERATVKCLRSLIESLNREPPRFALWRHPLVSIAVASIMKEFGIDPGYDRHLVFFRPVRLRDNALNDGFQSGDLGVRKKSCRRIPFETILYDLPRLLVPIRRSPFGEHVVTRIPRWEIVRH